MMLSERFDAALLFAAWLHRQQTRKGTPAPYLSHLLGVASLVLENGGNEEEAIAALLHDSIEDQGDRYPGGRPALRAFMEDRFGESVLAIVNACTDDDGHEKGTAPNPEEEARRWRVRKQEYLDHLATASPSVRLVSCADKLHNARALVTDYRKDGEALWKRFRAQNAGNQLWYYGELARIFLATLPGKLSAELESTVEQLKNRPAAG